MASDAQCNVEAGNRNLKAINDIVDAKTSQLGEQHVTGNRCRTDPLMTVFRFRGVVD